MHDSLIATQEVAARSTKQDKYGTRQVRNGSDAGRDQVDDVIGRTLFNN
jgi:hypothetical protein